MADENICEHQFLWKIENFSACIEDTSCYLKSPVIRAVDLDDSYWNVVLAPRGDMDDRFISVGLIRSSDDHGPTDLHLELELCLIDVYGEDHFKQCCSCTCQEHGTYTFREFVRRSDIFEHEDTLLPNDVLTLLIRAKKSDCNKFGSTKSVVRTKIHVKRSSYLWTIRGSTSQNAPASQKAFFDIESTSDRKDMELVCEYSNEPKSTGDVHLVRLAIRPKDVSEVQIFVSVKIQVLDSDLKPHTKIEAKHNFEVGCIDAWHPPRFDISDRMERVSDWDRVDLTFDFCISEGSNVIERERTMIPLFDKFYSDVNALQQDMKSVYESAIDVTTDIVLMACNEMQHVWAHKFILGARSLVFRAVLNRFANEKKDRFNLMVNLNTPAISEVCVRHEFITVYVENGTDYAEISNISLEVLAQMLQCMYTDTLNPDDENNAIHLYSAGVVFDFRLLREKSEDYLKSNISLKSFYTILEFAKLNGIVELKNECLNFIVNNWECILASDSWVILREAHVDLAQEILDILDS